MRRALIVFVVAGAFVGVAYAQAEERVSVGTVLRGVNKAAGKGYSRTLFIVVRSPAEYSRSPGGDADSGEWTGPRYQATANPSLGGNASIDWHVAFEFDTGPDNRAAVQQNLVHDWPVIEGGGTVVPHVIGGRSLGAIGASWLLTRSPFSGADDARYEGALAIQICGGFAVPGFSTLQPSSDDAGGSIGAGRYVINGTAPTAWNRQKVMESMNAVRIEGPLPVARLTARATGRHVTGTARDCHSHPSIGTPVTLQRRTGRGWRRVGSTRVAANGAFSLRARSAGTYRVVALPRTSRALRIR